MPWPAKAAILIAAALVSCRAIAEPAEQEREEMLSSIDELFEKAMAVNYSEKGRNMMAGSLADCERALDTSPSNYELLWRAARSAVELAECARIQESPDWKALCGSLIPKALGRSEAARLAAPARVEPYFWHMEAAGELYDALGAPAFVAAGLPSKVRRDVEACESIDASYLDYAGLLAQAMYYYSLPAVMGRDVAKAMRVYREFAAKTTWGFEPYRQLTEAAQLLFSTKKPEDEAEGRRLLSMALADSAPRPYYREVAAKLLARAD